VVECLGRANARVGGDVGVQKLGHGLARITTHIMRTDKICKVCMDLQDFFF
jgi:hypothetical protein